MNSPAGDHERKKATIRHFMHSPAQLSTALVEYRRSLDQNSFLKWPTKKLNEKLMLILPGRVYTFLGRPGHGKTTILISLAKSFAKQIQRAPRTGTKQKVVFYVTWETLVEDYEVALRGESDGFSISDFLESRVPMEKLDAQQKERVMLPVWGMGERGARGKEGVLEPLTFDLVEYALLHHDEFFGADIEIIAVVLDYLQKIPLSGRFKDRTAEVTEAIYLTELLAQKLLCPVFLGAQAGRETDLLKPPIPSARHGYYSAAIEHVSSGIYPLWRPIKTQKAPIKFNGTEIPVTDNLIMWGVEKGRGKRATGEMIPMYLSPDMCRLEDLQIDQFTGDVGRAGANDDSDDD